MTQNENEYYSMMGRLKENYLEEIFQQGEWHKFNHLNDVINRMKRDTTGNEDKHSIPDVYGRAFQLKISFDFIMKESAKQGNYLITKEILAWRGILTMLALQDFLNFRIKIDIVNYKEEGEAFDEALKYPPNSNIFKNELSWENRVFYIITLKGDKGDLCSDIAMFSPMTVVYPLAYFEMPKIKKLKWFDYQDQNFINPTDVLTKTEKMIVCFWINHLKNVLLMSGDGRESNIINYHLEAYDRELKKELGETDTILKKCFEIVAYDRNAENKLNEDVKNKVLNSTVKVYLWVNGKKELDHKNLFADQIYYTQNNKGSGSNPFIACSFSANHQIERTDNWYALIPLSKKIQELYDRKTIDDIMRTFQMKAYYDAKGEIEYIKVNLFLSKMSSDNVDIERKYYINSGDVIEEKNDFVVIALWPSKNMPEWKKYYIYLEGGKNGKIALNLKNAVFGSNDYVGVVDKFPNAITLKRIKDREEYDIGMILPECAEKRESEKEKARISAIVGIDFGTSGTTVYAKINDENKIIPIEIQRNSSKLLTTAGAAELAIMNQYFVMQKSSSDKEQKNKQNRLYSVYRRPKDELLENVDPILDGIIYQADENEMIEESKQFMPNIKWDNPNNGTYYKAFIEELCLHIWEELRDRNVTSIEWRYALPISIINSNTFHKMWENGIREFLNNSIDIAHNIEGRNHTESEATSLYFLNSEELKSVNRDKGYMVVDIGGGSTDIAVWQKQNSKMTMLAQTSVPVAGRFLFTRWIKLNLTRINECVFAKENPLKEQLSQLQMYKGEPSIINAVLERVINHNNEKIMKSYRQNPEWSQKLNKQLEFGMALMFFAMGSLVGYLQIHNILKVSKNGNFCIALGEMDRRY